CFFVILSWLQLFFTHPTMIPVVFPTRFNDFARFNSRRSERIEIFEFVSTGQEGVEYCESTEEFILRFSV
ncbi:5494_t:CDS:1, partial [Funneliformis geosporum]